MTGSNGYLFFFDYDIHGVEDQRWLKFKITSMPNVPIMAAATPATVPEASPAAG